MSTNRQPSPLMRFPEKYPESLEHMGQIIGQELMKMGFHSDEANSKAFVICEAIREELGGGPVYIHRGQEYVLSMREEKMWAEFKGDNYHELARRYDLSEMQVRNVINKAKAKMQQRSQLKLLDD
jgi:Mor family transcriptional regulator